MPTPKESIKDGYFWAAGLWIFGVTMLIAYMSWKALT